MPDSNTYKELASYIGHLSLKDYPGWRTPGYPLLLMTSGGRFYGIVIFIQFLFDIATTWLVYDLIRHWSKRIAWLAAFLFFTLAKGMFYEFGILTETTTLFLTTLIIWLINHYNIICNQVSIKITLLISILLGIVFLVRPMFIYLTPVLAVFMIFNLKKRQLKTQLIKVFIILIFPFSLYFGWQTLNYINNDWFTITTYSGITKAQCTMYFFDKAPDEYKSIRDIYVKHINEIDNIKNGIFNYSENYNLKAFKRMQQNGAFESIESLTIWRAINEMESSTGLTRVQLSQELNIICNDLIKQYPSEYFKQVWKGWLPFWKNNDLPINLNLAKHPAIIRAYRILMDIQKIIFIILNILLIPTLLIKIYNSVKRQQLFSFDIFLLAIIAAASIAQAMVTYGEGARFAYPFIGAILYSISNLFPSKQP